MHLHVLSYMVHVISSASMYVARAHEYLDMLICLFHTQTSPMHARVLTCASMHGNSVKVGRDSVAGAADVRWDNTGVWTLDEAFACWEGGS